MSAHVQECGWLYLRSVSAEDWMQMETGSADWTFQIITVKFSPPFPFFPFSSILYCPPVVQWKHCSSTMKLHLCNVSSWGGLLFLISFLTHLVWRSEIVKHGPVHVVKDCCNDRWLCCKDCPASSALKKFKHYIAETVCSLSSMSCTSYTNWTREMGFK